MADTKQIPSLKFEKYVYAPGSNSYDLPNTMYPTALKSVNEMLSEISGQYEVANS